MSEIFINYDLNIINIFIYFNIIMMQLNLIILFFNLNISWIYTGRLIMID